MLSTRHPPLLRWRLMLGAAVVTLYTSPNITTAQQPGLRTRGPGREEERGPRTELTRFPTAWLQVLRVLQTSGPHQHRKWTVPSFEYISWWHELSGCHFLSLLSVSMYLCIVQHCRVIHAGAFCLWWKILNDNVMGHSGQWSMVMRDNYMHC